MGRLSVIRESENKVADAREMKDEILASISNLLDAKLNQMMELLHLLAENEGSETIKTFKKLRSVYNGFENVQKFGNSLIDDLFDDDASSNSTSTVTSFQEERNKRREFETRSLREGNGRNHFPTKPENSDEYQQEKAKSDENRHEKETVGNRMSEAISLLPKLKVKKEFDAMFVHPGKGPALFYTRSIADAKKYQILENKLNESEKLPLYNLTDVSYPFFAVVRSPEYDKLFRAFVMCKKAGRNFEVFYCDWGNRELVRPEDIFIAPEGLVLHPAAAIPMALTSQKKEYIDWTPEMVQNFIKIAEKSPFLKVDIKEKIYLETCDLEAYGVAAIIRKSDASISLYDLLCNDTEAKVNVQKTNDSSTEVKNSVPLQSDLGNLCEETQDKLNLWFEKSAKDFADPHSNLPLSLPPEEELSERPPSPTGTCLTSVSQRPPTFQLNVN